MLCAYGKYIDNVMLLKAENDNYEGKHFFQTNQYEPCAY